MTKDIKKILEITETADYKRLSIDEIIVIKDYITNLQEENKRLRKERDKNLDNVMFLSKVNDEKQDKIDKAIEYIRNTFQIDLNGKYVYVDDLLNILQGEK